MHLIPILQQFFDTAEKQKASYEAAMEEWRESLTPQDIRRQNAYIAAQRKKGIKGTAMLRDPAKPKAPKTPFFSFMSDLRSKDPSGGAAAVVDFARKAGEQWKNMTADEKKVRIHGKIPLPRVLGKATALRQEQCGA